jgi:hypothetical protein
MQKIAITIFPIILCLYFFGVFISNIVSLSPALSAFFTAGTSKFVWRAIIALIYGAYIVFVVIVFKIKFNHIYTVAVFGVPGYALIVCYFCICYFVICFYGQLHCCGPPVFNSFNLFSQYARPHPIK